MIRGRPTASFGRSEAAATHIAWQVGHSDRCFSSFRSASLTRRKTCSGRSIPASFTASRDAGAHSRNVSGPRAT